MMSDLLARLSSRKFVLSVAAAVTFLANKQYTEAAAVVAAFVFGEAAIDIAAVRKGKSDVEAKIDEVSDVVEEVLDKTEEKLDDFDEV